MAYHFIYNIYNINSSNIIIQSIKNKINKNIDYSEAIKTFIILRKLGEYILDLNRSKNINDFIKYINIVFKEELYNELIKYNNLDNNLCYAVLNTYKKTQNNFIKEQLLILIKLSNYLNLKENLKDIDISQCQVLNKYIDEFLFTKDSISDFVNMINMDIDTIKLINIHKILYNIKKLAKCCMIDNINSNYKYRNYKYNFAYELTLNKEYIDIFSAFVDFIKYNKDLNIEFIEKLNIQNIADTFKNMILSYHQSMLNFNNHKEYKQINNIKIFADKYNGVNQSLNKDNSIIYNILNTIEKLEEINIIFTEIKTMIFNDTNIKNIAMIFEEYENIYLVDNDKVYLW